MFATFLFAAALIPQPQEVVWHEGFADVSAIVRTNDATLPPEGYRISATETGVSIAAADSAGMFYAEQTLAQLQEQGRVPCCEIADWPQFKWRGVLLDESRHFFGKDAVLSLLSLMSRYKLNTLHWHGIDDQGWRFPSKRFPELKAAATRELSSDHRKLYDTGKQGLYGPFAYTEVSLREIEVFAREHSIVIVPELECPGHSLAVLKAFPQFRCPVDGAPENVFCIGNDKALAFLDAALDELCELFPGKYFHIGGDEVDRSGWEKCPLCKRCMESQKLADTKALRTWVLERLSKRLEQKGRTAIWWSDAPGELPPPAVAMSWHGLECGQAAAQENRPAIMCPHLSCYYDYPQGLAGDANVYPWFAAKVRLTTEKAYMFDPIAGVSFAKQGNILGGECCNWGEYTCTVPELQWKMWPRTLAMAEVLWTAPRLRNSAGFLRRAQVHREWLVRNGVNAAPCVSH